LKLEEGVPYAFYYHTVGDTIFKLVFKHYKEYFYNGYAYALPKIKGSGKRIKNKEYVLGLQEKLDEKPTVQKERVWDEQLNRMVEKVVKRQTVIVCGMQEVK